MMDIREFLEARLQDDERVATVLAEHLGADGHGEWQRSGGGLASGSYELLAAHRAVGQLSSWHLEHIARHDPARVLRDVEAARRTLRLYDNAVAAVAAGSLSQRNRTQDETAVEMLGVVLRALAAVHADHPDYDPSWAPS